MATTLTHEEKSLFQEGHGAIIAADEEGIIRFVTPEAEGLLHRQDLDDQPLTTLMPQRLVPQHEAGFRRFLRTGVSRLEGRTVRVPALCGDGHEHDVDLTIRVFRRPDASMLVVAQLDQPGTNDPQKLLHIEDTLRRRAYQLI